VLGEWPAETLDEAIGPIIARGMPATLPQDIIDTGQARREVEGELGPWSEGKYRPGRPARPRRKR
jgi:hypothetical protein